MTTRFSSLSPLFAPFAFALGRTLKSDALIDWSCRLDPTYARSHLHKIGRNGWSQLEAQRFTKVTQLMAALTTDCGPLLRDSYSNSRAQLLQDLFVVAATEGKRNGYFVEIGVGDGENLSNTYLLEKLYGWSGLLAEPNPAFHDSIEAKRSARLDRRAAFSRTGLQLDLLMDSNAGELSTLSEFDGRDAHKREGITTAVSTVTLDDLLAEHDAPRTIDYVSIDTEGSEYEVLKGLDLDKWRILVFTIESNFDTQKMKKIEEILFAHGYRRVLERVSAFDSWYVHADVRQIAG